MLYFLNFLVAPQLAFTHYAGSMFISDVQSQPVDLSDDVDIVQLSREGQPFFASVLERRSASVLLNLERSLLDDPGNRGVAHLYQESDLIKATLALSHASRVAVTTGCPVHAHLEVKEETDGIPGALSVCQALTALGKEVVLISDSQSQRLFESCVEHSRKEGTLSSPVEVITCSKAIELWDGATGLGHAPPWDCLLAIERAGRGKDGVHWTMKAAPLSVDPVDDLFLKALSHSSVSTIAIGDGGNELGMGKVHEQVVKHIPHGDTIASTTPADFVIASGVSNWAGHALSLALYVVSASSPMHWRYRNHGIGVNQPPSLDKQDFFPTTSQVGFFFTYHTRAL